MKRFASYALACSLIMLGFLVLQHRAGLQQGGQDEVRAVGAASNATAGVPDLTAPKEGQTQGGAVSVGVPSTPRSEGMPPNTLAPKGQQTQAATKSRPWDREFLSRLREAVQGDAIRFELVGGVEADGIIGHLEHRDGELMYISGRLSAPEEGRFFFQKQTARGVAGEYAGVVEFPTSKKAYRIEPTGPGGAPELVERSLEKVICLGMPPAPGDEPEDPQEIPPLRPEDFPTVPIPDYQTGIIVLESLPGAQQVIYMDYQGGYTPTWGGITYARPTANNSQIRDVWKRVAEDFMPFNINVTTDLKVFQNAPETSRQRVIVTPTTTAAPGAGGVAYYDSFNWTGDTPCWAFYATGKNAAEVITHEAGHTLNLSHDGNPSSGYEDGHGSGETGWAPIMGAGYYQNVTEWSRGEYLNANNPQDDLDIITSRNNNVTYRPDDIGETLASSRYLEIYSNDFAKAEGVIERTEDTDAFQFTTSGGTVSLRANPVASGPNLGIMARLYDADGVLLASNNPQNVLWAAITSTVPAGTYTFCVTGAGRNSPLTNGFSSYASLGYYMVTGMVANARRPDRFAIAEHSTNGLLVGVVQAVNSGGDPLVYTVTSGNVSNTFALDNLGRLTVANNAMLDYEVLARDTQMPVQYEMFVDISNTVSSVIERKRRVVVAVTNVNERPSITGFDVVLLEHTVSGTLIGQVTFSDPDYWTLLSNSIPAGNSNGMFSIESQTGNIRVAGDLNTVTQSVYNLRVVVSDQTAPVPLTSTTMVNVTVVPNTTGCRPGTISYSVYTNISGTTIATLTNAPAFPFAPGLEKQVTSFEGDSNRGDTYGAAIRGYLIPPATGNYTFWVSSDDNGDLWLGSNTNPATATRIAYITGNNSYSGPREWTKYASQQSSAISLVAGEAYYIEGRVKESSGNDHVEVAWACTSAGIAREVIPGRYLAPYFLNYTPQVLAFTYALHRDALLYSRIGPVVVTDLNTNDDHTFSIVGGNSTGLFAIDPSTGFIRMTNDVTLQAIFQTNHLLQVRAADNGVPARAVTNTITIRLWPSNAITTTSIQRELWTNIGTGNYVSNLTSQAKYPRRPDLLRPLSLLESGENFGDSYGSRVRALLTPTNTGNFTFFIASDDQSQLKLSTNSEAAGATQIASLSSASDYREWTQSSSQRSAAMALTSGQRYYVEALHKEGTGGDHLAVGWTGAGLPTTNVIAGAFLRPANLNYAPEMANRAAPVGINVTNGTVLMTLIATDAPMDLLTYKIVSGNDGNTFSLDPDNARLSVADNTMIVTYLASSFTLGVQVQDSGYGGLFPLQSTQVVVSVQVLNNTLPFYWTGLGTNDNWSAGANWKGIAPGENSKLVFSGTSRQTNINDLLSQLGPFVISNGGFRMTGRPVKVLAGFTSMGDNAWAIDSTLNKPQAFTNYSGVLTLAGAMTNNGHLLTLIASNTIRLEGPISGAGGLEKLGDGMLLIASSNTFTGPTVVAAGTVQLMETGSLSASGSVELREGTTLDAGEVSGGLTVPASQTLLGDGAVLGSVSVYGLLSPGPSIGMLQISSNLALFGETFLEISKSGAAITNDTVVAGGKVMFGGQLTITQTGDSLAVGDRFHLFRASNFTNSFARIVLPTLPGNAAWDVSQLGVDGSIRVIAASGPELRLVSLTNGSLSFVLDSQANTDYVLEATDDIRPPMIWTPVSTNAGTGGTITISTPVIPAHPQRFYRLRGD